jgi:serine protease Do
MNENNNGMKNRIVSYIIIGVICCTLGGVGSAIITINIMNGNSTASSNIDSLIAPNSTQSLSVPEIVKKVSPSVVEICTRKGEGTGMIFNANGYILTNYHVISGFKNVKVILSNGKEVTAKVINYDTVSDLAVIKLADNTKVPGVIQFGNSAILRVGESVVAIGNPLGTAFLETVTTGVVSALNRHITIKNSNLTFIQTDAAINSGNSGGPLINTKGQVIGMNTAKISEEGVAGLGFSIPINTVKSEINTLDKPMSSIEVICKNIAQYELKMLTNLRI